jgi:polar amino acid transport system substrate-binding protein
MVNSDGETSDHAGSDYGDIAEREDQDRRNLNAPDSGHTASIGSLPGTIAIEDTEAAMLGLTRESGVLAVAAAFPDPPFDIAIDGRHEGFDVALMQAIGTELELAVRFVPYSGDDFNGIFDGLAGGNYDAVASGTTITPERQEIAIFSDPYLTFDQGLIVNRTRNPMARSTNDLHGLTAGIQRGNTSDAVAQRLLAEGKIAQVRYYPYHGILDALDDLSAGRIGAVIKLYPVAVSLVKGRRDLAVVAQIPTHEHLGVAFARSNTALRDAVNGALASLTARGIVEQLRRTWID